MKVTPCNRHAEMRSRHRCSIWLCSRTCFLLLPLRSGNPYKYLLLRRGGGPRPALRARLHVWHGMPNHNALRSPEQIKVRSLEKTASSKMSWLAPCLMSMQAANMPADAQLQQATAPRKKFQHQSLPSVAIQKTKLAQYTKASFSPASVQCAHLPPTHRPAGRGLTGRCAAAGTTPSTAAAGRLRTSGTAAGRRRTL